MIKDQHRVFSQGFPSSPSKNPGPTLIIVRLERWDEIRGIHASAFIWQISSEIDPHWRSKAIATVSYDNADKRHEDQLWWYLSEPSMTEKSRESDLSQEHFSSPSLESKHIKSIEKLCFQHCAAKSYWWLFFFFFASENTAQVLRQRAAPLIKDGKIKSELKLLLFMSNELMPVSRKMDPDFTAAAAAVAIGSQISPWNRISKARSFFLLSARFDLGSSFFFFFFAPQLDFACINSLQRSHICKGHVRDHSRLSA